MRLVIAGGGTGGHLFPALAVAEAIAKEVPGASVLFIGTTHGIEARTIPGTGFDIRYIKVRGIRGTGLLNTVRAASELPAAVLQSVSILREFKPDVVLGVGGYASGPVLLGALLMRIPTAIQEQNSVMGTTNRILSSFVDRVFISWEHTEPATPREKTSVTGNPIRADLLEPVEPIPAGKGFNLLVFGGSQGARSINRAMTTGLDEQTDIAEKVAILHQTGRDAVDEVRKAYDGAGFHADVREFVHDMRAAYGWADLVVCRSGASSLAELTALGKAAIVVPFPYAIGDHQAKNAAVLQVAGAVGVIPDAELKDGLLWRTIRGLMENPDRLAALAGNSLRLGRPEAARTIASALLGMKRSRR
ncbi:MAG: undecaprenyldiphospho-muramoylpentapeptide beta-N-acetylglucosaminyltransferase [Pseudomonadota bacterium]